jgi:hypothetical protein
MVLARGYPERGSCAILFFRSLVLAALSARVAGGRVDVGEGELEREAYGVGGGGGGAGALGIQIHW